MDLEQRVRTYVVDEGLGKLDRGEREGVPSEDEIVDRYLSQIIRGGEATFPVPSEWSRNPPELYKE